MKNGSEACGVVAEAPTLGLDLVQTLMDTLPGVMYWVKDRSLAYRYLNDAALEFCGVEARSQLLGRGAREFLPELTWKQLEGREREVMRTRVPAGDRLCLAADARGREVWLLASWWPLLALDETVAGVAALARFAKNSEKRHSTYTRLKRVVDYVEANLGAAIEIGHLASRVGVSVSQLERDFIAAFGIAPAAYITKARLQLAMERLVRGGSVAMIAYECGYSDQSAFTRRFRAMTGMTPMEFRRSRTPLHPSSPLRV
jgi:PAS domain S-box-containing protein